ncbi:MAG: glycosyltransferase family 2 protein [Bacteroidota bacterium]|nr:glycosyltransferase family 2 protein [Bacteroidota bacterium]
MTNAFVTIIIPCFNEGPVLRQVVAELVNEKKYTIILVDDGSVVPAQSLIGDLPVTIIRHIANLGQGAALQTGFEYVKKLPADYVITFDADGQHAPSDIQQLLAPLQDGRADIALGSRFLIKGQQNAPLTKKWVLHAGRLVNYFFSGLYLSDSHNGLRAFTKAAIEKIALKENRMAHATEILYAIRKHKLRHIEVPVTINYTFYSKSKGQSVFNSIRIFFDLVLHKIFE